MITSLISVKVAVATCCPNILNKARVETGGYQSSILAILQNQQCQYVSEMPEMSNKEKKKKGEH